MFISSHVVFILHEFCFLSLSPKSVSPEDSEKKRTNYQAYRSYLNREGPKALGSKEIPKVREVTRACHSVMTSTSSVQYVFTLLTATEN
jgi:hypothetical protein